MRKVLVSSICLILYLNVQATDRDSSRKHSFHLLLSFNPVFTSLGNNPSKTNLFYSSVPYEIQYGFKRHLFGASYLKNYKNDIESVNGTNTVFDVARYRFHLNYTYEFKQGKRFVLQSGLGYYFDSQDSMEVMYTPLENPYKRWHQVEQGVGALVRLGYKFNKFISVCLESQLYLGVSRYSYDYVYPLLPSQNQSGKKSSPTHHILLPSNLFLRISIQS